MSKLRRRTTWKEYRIECCSDCGKQLEAAWHSHHQAFPDGKRFIALEPGTYMTNLSLRDVRTLRTFSFMHHRLDAPLTGYDPDGPAPWDEEERNDA
jgi:hypothetical protein